MRASTDLLVSHAGQACPDVPETRSGGLPPIASLPPPAGGTFMARLPKAHTVEGPGGRIRARMFGGTRGSGHRLERLR